MTKCELCGKSIRWLDFDYVILTPETVGKYELPDGEIEELYRTRKAHRDCVRRYGKKIG